jgi:hypothetical protein
MKLRKLKKNLKIPNNNRSKNFKIKQVFSQKVLKF